MKWLFCIIILVATACRAEEIVLPNELKPAIVTEHKSDCVNNIFERLSVGSRLRITIYGHADISREVEIGPEGKVIIPMIGEVPAEGKTTQMLVQDVTDRLDDANLISSGVEVEIVKYPQIYITGLVGASGAYDYKPRINVRQAVALAGGFSPRARTSNVRILRTDPCNKTAQEIMADMDAEVLPSDTIEVLRRWF